MKTWLTYLAAVAAGLSVVLIFKDSALFFSVVSICSNILLKLGIFLIIPMVFFSMTASTASLRREEGQLGKVWGKAIIWNLISVIILSFFAAAIFYLIPAKFPTTSSTGTQSNLQEYFVQLNKALVDSNFTLKTNAFQNLMVSAGSLLPVIFVAFIIGFFLKPNSDIIRPAYAVTNSFSEIFMRMAKFITTYGWIFIFFISMSWFTNIWNDGSIFVALKFLLLISVVLFVQMFLVIPLLFAFFTGFRINPYKQIIRLWGTSLAGLVSGNILFALPSAYALCRNNLGIQKKVLNTTIPISTIIGRGGTAMVSTITVLSLIFGSTGEMPSFTVILIISLNCSLISFLSSMHLGYEVLFVSVFTLFIMNIDLWGAEASIIAFVPILNGLGIMFDSILAGMGSSYVAGTMKADCNIRTQDIV